MKNGGSFQFATLPEGRSKSWQLGQEENDRLRQTVENLRREVSALRLTEKGLQDLQSRRGRSFRGVSAEGWDLMGFNGDLMRI